ncbi:hypothetical protein HY375_02925 [Candidatus Berkelbacteria bacterium]|nr:hypothetical protein [Candidatus Berkelbacteria bacterium]
MTLKERAVLTPIVFFDLFDRPVRPAGLKHLVYGQSMTESEFESILTELERRREIIRRRGFLSLPDRPGLTENGIRRDQISTELAKEAATVIGRLASVPFVKMIAIINSLAFWNANQDSDIDILVVTEPGRIAIARDHINLLLTFWGRRNTRGVKRGKIAPDVFLDTDRLALEDFHMSPHDIYFDFWCARITPIINRDGTYERLLAANPWIRKVFPVFQPRTEFIVPPRPDREVRRKGWEWFYQHTPIGRWWGAVMTNRAGARLRRYQARSGERDLVVVSPHVLRFHVPDKRPEYQAQFEARWHALSGSHS